MSGTSPQATQWTRILVRRTVPFAALAAVFAIQALANADPVIAFPLYLTVVLVVSLQENRAESIAVAVVAAMAVLFKPVVVTGSAADVAPAAILALVLVGVGFVFNELAKRFRESAAVTRRQVIDVSASERQLRAMVEVATVGLALASIDGRLVHSNERLAGILGCSRDELLRSSLAQVVSEKDRRAVDDALMLLRGGDVAGWDAEVSLLRSDGTQVPSAIYLARTTDSASAEPILLLQVIDLVAHNRVDSLRECSSAVREIIIGSSQPDQAIPRILGVLSGNLGWKLAQYWAVEREKNALRVRHALPSSVPIYQIFLQESRNAAIANGEGLVGRAWHSGVISTEEDLQKAENYDLRTAAQAANLRSAIAVPVVDGWSIVGVIELIDDRLHDRDPNEIAVLADAGVEIGQFIRRSEVAQALRRSEADHRAIYERSPIGIARISSDGELLEANPALLQMLGHDIQTMRTTAWPELLRAYDEAASRQHKPQFLAGITDGTSIQVRAATATGRWLWLQLTATTIPDMSGRPEHVLVLVEDVTTVRETSDKLAEALDAQREANANLEKLDRTKSEFLSIVSHEFRTALTGIQGFSELIRDGGLEADEVKAYGGYIFNDADRVNRLIGDMLDLDRMESGRMTMRTTSVDINDLLTEAISRAAPSAVTVEFRADLDPRLPIVACDRDRLIQVVSNLVNNAIKYSPEGGTVTLSSRVEGGFALISVSDTGIGIPPEEIGHVFERFRRVRSGAAQSIPGTGLGLTIVKQIVEMHGGKIWVESAVSHGSSFHFTIPLAAEAAVPAQLRHG